MKILMTADTVGGVWTYAMELIRTLYECGMDVALATMGGRMNPQQRAECDRSRCAAVFESDFRLEWMDNPWTDLCKSSDWLLDIESEIHPDVIHLNGYFHAALPWSAPVLVVGHSCVLSWWQAVKDEPAPESFWAKYRRRVILGLRAADYVVAPSRAMLESIHTFYGVRARDSVIPNGRGSSLFAPGKKENLILSAGRLWDEAKNIVALDRIAKQLLWPVYVAGDCGAPNGAEGSFQGLDVKPLGRLSSAQIADWMARASIYCLPARYEPFGLSILEAALSGCALVLGDIPSLRENWDGAALFVPPKDENRLASALNSLSCNESLRTELAECARKRAADFSPQRMAENYVDIYAALIGDRTASKPLRREASACAS
jgi:glycogen(starch) synthase